MAIASVEVRILDRKPFERLMTALPDLLQALRDYDAMLPDRVREAGVELREAADELVMRSVIE